MQHRFIGGALIALSLSALAAAGDWSPRLAANYLDQRQKQWFEWAPTKASGGPCVSCHTGVTYLLARPMLRRALGEDAPTSYEKGLLDGLRTRVATGESMFPSIRKEPTRTQARNVEAAIAALFLKPDDGPVWERVRNFENSAEAEQRLWGFQLALDPWESESSSYMVATLVAAAEAKSSPGPRMAGLSAYLKREYSAQPLHQKVMALWTPVLDAGARDELVKEIWRRQAPDGGWSDEALGSWSEHSAKPESKGSSAYATGLIAFTLQQAGAGCKDDRLERAKGWLRSHQNPETGAWTALSMNKKYPPGSMQAGFMDDAATGFAVMALLDRGVCDGPLR